MTGASAAGSPGLRVLGDTPFNAETRVETLSGMLTQPGRHYVRNHFAVPEPIGVLRIDGSVASPLEVTIADLVALTTWRSTVTLECAGNGRGSLVPPAPGEQWGIGAVGTAEWAGVPLADLLADAAPAADTVELVFTGADAGRVAAADRTMPFQRSMPIGDVDRAFVAVTMNGLPLTPNHGAPMRLLVPGRYGMASVKWLSRITAVIQPFRGFFQVDRYVVDGRPLGPIAPRAVIVSPADGERVEPAGTTIRGYAWAGVGPIQRVEISTDGGAIWSDASLGPAVSATSWREWSAAWQPLGAGEVTIVARATDLSGATQPLQQVRNDLGYGNNAAMPVTVTVD